MPLAVDGFLVLMALVLDASREFVAPHADETL